MILRFLFLFFLLLFGYETMPITYDIDAKQNKYVKISFCSDISCNLAARLKDKKTEIQPNIGTKTCLDAKSFEIFC